MDHELGGSAGIDEAIRMLERVVATSQRSEAPTLTALATLEMQRDSARGGDGCVDDMDCAKKNLERALVIDDGYMPALNGLALCYLHRAQSRAAGHQADTQQVEMAAQIAILAMGRNATYAPIRNTAGLIESELGRSDLAARFFAEAASLDPRLFEAHANYGLAALSFHDFAAAEAALRRAITLRPRDYDAHLGLATALRGQIDPARDLDAQTSAVLFEIDRCKELDPDRPEAIFNEAILTQEYGTTAARGADRLRRAKQLFEAFVRAAGATPRYAEAVASAKRRIEDIDDRVGLLADVVVTDTVLEHR